MSRLVRLKGTVYIVNICIVDSERLGESDKYA